MQLAHSLHFQSMLQTYPGDPPPPPPPPPPLLELLEELELWLEQSVVLLLSLSLQADVKLLSVMFSISLMQTLFTVVLILSTYAVFLKFKLLRSMPLIIIAPLPLLIGVMFMLPKSKMLVSLNVQLKSTRGSEPFVMLKSYVPLKIPLRF